MGSLDYASTEADLPESTLTELNGNMIIKTTGDNHRQITGLLGRLRETRAVQISVEARFLSVDKNFLDEFRLDFDVVLNTENADLDLDGLPDNGANTLPVRFSATSTAASRTFLPAT